MQEIKAYKMDDGSLIAGEAIALRYKLEMILCRGARPLSSMANTVADMVEAIIEQDSEVVALLQRVRRIEPVVRAKTS